MLLLVTFMLGVIFHWVQFEKILELKEKQKLIYRIDNQTYNNSSIYLIKLDIVTDFFELTDIARYHNF